MLTQKKPAFLLLFLLISFGSVSAVLFTPALPAISTYFGVNNHTAQLTITWFLIGYAVGQLLYGPLANGYGRKIALYIGIVIEIAASLMCVLSAHLHAFWLLVTARLFMALGASAGLKMSFTLIADSYTPEESTRVISNLMIAFAITPGLGIALGGYLTQYLGWQSCFYFLALYGVLLLYLTYCMQETVSQMDSNALKLYNIVYKYTRKLQNIQLLLGAMLMGIGTAFVYLFAALAPFVTMQWMHLNPSQYGVWNLLPPIGIMAGSQLSARSAKNLRPIRAILLGLVIMLVGTVIIFSAFASHALCPIGLFLPLALIYVGMSFFFANASTLAMQSAQDKSTASAMMNFINMGIATLSVLVVGMINNQPILLLPIVYFLLIGFAFLLALILAAKQQVPYEKSINRFDCPKVE